MDCEKFESAMIDELYGELDELTSAAAKRHLAGCARCSARMAALRAVRRVATVPLVEPPVDLEGRILAAADRAWTSKSTRPTLAQWISLAGSWAMRPQTAMAAVFLVMTGTSVLLLRVKSARAPVSADITVTERGTPAPAVVGSVALGPADSAWTAPAPSAVGLADEPRAFSSPPPALAKATAPQPVAAAPALRAARPMAESKTATRGLADSEWAEEPFSDAQAQYRAGRFDDAARGFDALAQTDVNAMLWAARSVREGHGCAAAVARFDRTARQARQSPPGWDALLEGALCYRQMGDFAAARSRLNGLLGVDSHKDRARAELARLDQLQQAQSSTEPVPVAKGAHARSAQAVTAAPPPATQAAPAAPPAATSVVDVPSEPSN